MNMYRWAMIGCGSIANEFALAMKKKGMQICGAASRTHSSAVDFAEKHGISRVYQNPRELLEDEEIDIVYIATPHNTHIQYLLEALRHGKHVLCEKSITLNSSELTEAKRLAKEHHVVLAEAMTIYHMPLYKELHTIAAGGTLGALQMVQMNFGSYKEYDMTNRFFNPDLAGGALLDIGVYALAFIRWFLSEKPDQVISQVKLAPSGVDERASILLMNPAGEMASVSLTLHAKQPKRGTAVFEKGYIEIFDYPRAECAVITYTPDGTKKTISCGSTADALCYEIRDMERAVSGGENEMHLDYTADVMDIMTKLRKTWGVKYPNEE